MIFQLTPSRRATVYRETIRYNRNISTHALTEGDSVILLLAARNSHFNSRPHGGRHYLFLHLFFPIHISTHALTEGDRAVPEICTSFFSFQLTPSRRATYAFPHSACNLDISTHALTEGDPGGYIGQSTWRYFNSRPHGGRLKLLENAEGDNISTHALTEGDVSLVKEELKLLEFQLTPSRRATGS